MTTTTTMTTTSVVAAAAVTTQTLGIIYETRLCFICFGSVLSLTMFRFEFNFIVHMHSTQKMWQKWPLFNTNTIAHTYTEKERKRDPSIRSHPLKWNRSLNLLAYLYCLFFCAESLRLTAIPQSISFVRFVLVYVFMIVARAPFILHFNDDDSTNDGDNSL